MPSALTPYAIGLDPDEPDVCYSLGNALRRLDLREEAADAYREAVRLAPEDADPHYFLGNLLSELCHDAEAHGINRQG